MSLCLYVFACLPGDFSRFPILHQRNPSTSLLDPIFTRYIGLSLWFALHGPWYGILALLLSWSGLLLSRHSPQTVTLGVMSIALMPKVASTSMLGWSLDRAAIIKHKGSTLATWPAGLLNNFLFNNIKGLWFRIWTAGRSKPTSAEQMPKFLPQTSSRATMWCWLRLCKSATFISHLFCILCSMSA